MSNFKENIINLIDNYYINWDPCFNSDIIKIINLKSDHQSNGNYKINNEKFYYYLKKIGGSNYKNLLKISFSSNDFGYEYNFNGVIGSGSCGSIMSYNKINFSGEKIGEFAFKFSFNGEDDTSRNESTIHYIINLFQKENNVLVVPKLDAILLTKDNFFHIMMEKLNYDLYSFFNQYDPLIDISKEFSDFSYWNLYLEFLYQMSTKLILLQDNFSFMHNDLKCNNILVKESYIKKGFFDKKTYLDYSNIEFLLCDFGGSSYIYDNKKYEGTILGSNSNYNNCKDLFHLVHMHLSFSNHRVKLVEFIKQFNIFNLEYGLISSKRENWIKIYTYIEDGNIIDECFNPRNLKKKLISISN